MSDPSILSRKHPHVGPPSVPSINTSASTSIMKHSPAWLGMTKHNADITTQTTSLQIPSTLQASSSALEIPKTHRQQLLWSACLRTAKHTADMTMQTSSTPTFSRPSASNSSLGVIGSPPQQMPLSAWLGTVKHNTDVVIHTTSTRTPSTLPAKPPSLAVLSPPRPKPPDKPIHAAPASTTGKTRVTYTHLSLPPPRYTDLSLPVLPPDINGGRGGGSAKELDRGRSCPWKCHGTGDPG